VVGSVRRPADRANFSARVDHALTKSHTLRASYQRNGTISRNLGVGDFDLPARAYSGDTTEDVFRLSQSGPVARNFFNETRFQVRHQINESASLTDAPTHRRCWSSTPSLQVEPRSRAGAAARTSSL
jgi:hypothetical protein